MTKFEYKVERYSYNGEEPSEAKLAQDANVLGPQGWELISVTPVLGKSDLVAVYSRSDDTVQKAIDEARATLNGVLDDAEAPAESLISAAGKAVEILNAVSPPAEG